MSAVPSSVLSSWPEQARAAWRRLSEKGLASFGGSLSLRVPGAATFTLIEDRATDASSDHAFDASGGVAGVHAAIYRARPDVGAVFISRQPWARNLSDLQLTMPAVFDEQVRHLGKRVERLAWPVADLPNRAAEALATQANAYVLDDAVLCLGLTRDRLVFNAELLEKCAKAFVLATLTGLPVRKLPWLVQFIANRRLLKDERSAAQAYARGDVPTGLNAY